MKVGRNFWFWTFLFIPKLWHISKVFPNLQFTGYLLNRNNNSSWFLLSWWEFSTFSIYETASKVICQDLISIQDQVADRPFKFLYCESIFLTGGKVIWSMEQIWKVLMLTWDGMSWVLVIRSIFLCRKVIDRSAAIVLLPIWNTNSC